MRRDELWNLRNGTYIETTRPTGYDVLINGTNRYLNFNTTSGTSGYGIRDNAGTMEFKNNGGSWTAFGSGSGGVTSLSAPDSTITLSANTGAINIYVNQNATYNWGAPHAWGDTATFNSAAVFNATADFFGLSTFHTETFFLDQIDFTPPNSTAQFIVLHPDGGNQPSKIMFLDQANSIGNGISLRAPDNITKPYDLIFPDGQPNAGDILQSIDNTGTLAWVAAGTGTGDVVGPSSSTNLGVAIFNGTTGKIIQDYTSVSSWKLGSTSQYDTSSNILQIGNSTSGYFGSFYGTVNGTSGLDVYNSNTGTSKASAVYIHSGASAGADTWGSITAYPSNYTNTGLAARFVIEAGTSQIMMFKTDSSFAWLNGTTEYMRLSGGALGIGNSPTGWLDVKAGTTATPTVVLRNGTLTTTAVTGAMEYTSPLLYFTPVGTIRKVIPTGLLGRSTAQTAAVASVAAHTVAGADATYRVSANVLVTTSTVHSFTVTCAYTDEGNTARTLTLSFSNLAGTILTAIANAAGAVPYEGVPLHIRAKSGTTITIATTGTFTTVTYNVEGLISLVS